MHHPLRFPAVLASLLLAAALTSTPNAIAQEPAAGATKSPQPDKDKAPDAAVENSVVKIFSSVRGPDLAKPWTKQAAREISGTGVVIEGKRILTNAHVVLYASQVQVQANQSGDKLAATVEFIAPGIDLAVLKLEDESFFDTHAALQRASSLPQIKDAVLVYGFPTGGTSLSITKGIVSRIEFAAYNYPVAGLRVQIDAAINPGNSGGPALVGDKVIGLAFSHLTNAQNIGYIIPSEEIDLFLKDVADGRFDGKPGLFDEFQTLENPAMRAYLKLDKSVQGIVVHEVANDDPAYPLKPWDVVTKIGDTSIDDQGMIKLSDSLRVRFVYLVQKLAKDGKVPLTVVRANKELTVQLPVVSSRPKLIPYLQGAYPSYFVYGPIVFSVATEDIIAAMSGGANGSNIGNALGLMGSPLATRRSDQPATEGEGLVIVPSPFFPHKLSKGFGPPSIKIVKSINGTPVKNLLHLVQLLREARDEFVVVEFVGHNSETLVFPRKETLAATDEILNDNGVRAQGSPDALAVWNAKPAP
jgi:S1-C subfamily serine protease